MILLLIVMGIISLLMFASFGFIVLEVKDGLSGLAALGWLMSLVMVTWRIINMTQ